MFIKSDLNIYTINEISKTNFSLRHKNIYMSKKPQSHRLKSKTYRKWSRKQRFKLHKKAKQASLSNEEKIKEEKRKKILENLSNQIFNNHKISNDRIPIRKLYYSNNYKISKNRLPIRRHYFSEDEINTSRFFSLKNITI